MSSPGPNEIPWTFLETTIQLTNFSSADATVYASDKVPDGFIGIVRDANVIFTTAGGGIYFRKRHKSGGSTRFTDNFATTATGLNALVVGGDKIEIAIGTAGIGVVDIIWHGVIVKTKIAGLLAREQVPEHLLVQDGI